MPLAVFLWASGPMARSKCGEVVQQVRLLRRFWRDFLGDIFFSGKAREKCNKEHFGRSAGRASWCVLRVCEGQPWRPAPSSSSARRGAARCVSFSHQLFASHTTPTVYFYALFSHNLAAVGSLAEGTLSPLLSSPSISSASISSDPSAPLPPSPLHSTHTSRTHPPD
jgi:hypothetical protein